RIAVGPLRGEATSASPPAGCRRSRPPGREGWPRVAVTTERREAAPSTVPPITRPTCWTRTDTGSRSRSTRTEPVAEREQREEPDVTSESRDQWFWADRAQPVSGRVRGRERARVRRRQRHHGRRHARAPAQVRLDPRPLP